MSMLKIGNNIVNTSLIGLININKSKDADILLSVKVGYNDHGTGITYTYNIKSFEALQTFANGLSNMCNVEITPYELLLETGMTVNEINVYMDSVMESRINSVKIES